MIYVIANYYPVMLLTCDREVLDLASCSWMIEVCSFDVQIYFSLAQSRKINK